MHAEQERFFKPDLSGYFSYYQSQTLIEHILSLVWPVLSERTLTYSIKVFSSSYVCQHGGEIQMN
jgi:hypothetical protein